MAIKLSANYSKKLGLPNYSSHSFSASLEIELSDISQAEQEIQKLYALLQTSVDQEIQQTGFVPQSNGNNGHQRQHQNGDGQAKPKSEKWLCTEGQRGFILRLVSENNLQKQDIEDLSNQLFQTGVKQLNRMQASQLIEEILAKCGKPAGRSRWSQPEPQRT
jgi:hypothetical protein